MPQQDACGRTAPQLASKREVAAMLSVSVRHIERLIADGTLRAIRIGRACRLDLRDVIRFVDQQRGSGC